MFLSGQGNFDFTRRASSTVSSIFDLSYEADQLDRAIRDNDICIVKKILEVHLYRFNVSSSVQSNVSTHDIKSVSMADSSRCPSRLSHEPGPSGEVDLTLRRCYMLDRFDRRGSGTTEADTPPIFKSALHVAVQSKSMDVLNLLLRYGVDPNEPGSVYNDGRRCGSISEITHHRDRKDVRFMLYGSTGKVDHTEDRNENNNKTKSHSLSLHRLPSPNHSSMLHPSSAASHSWSMKERRSSEGVTKPLLHASRSLETRSTDFLNTDGLNFARHYTAEILQTLPPLYLAAAERHAPTVRLLLSHGAKPNHQDAVGCTPLHLSASVDFQSWECALALIEYGAKVHIPNKFGQKPSDLSPDLVKEQLRLLSDTLLHSLPSCAQAASSQQSDSRQSEYHGLGAKILKRWNHSSSNGERASVPQVQCDVTITQPGGRATTKSKGRRATKERERENSSGWEREEPSFTERERASSLSSSKSRFSWNIRFSSSPQTSHCEEIEMDSRIIDSERVSGHTYSNIAVCHNMHELLNCIMCFLIVVRVYFTHVPEHSSQYLLCLIERLQ